MPKINRANAQTIWDTTYEGFRTGYSPYEFSVNTAASRENNGSDTIRVHLCHEHEYGTYRTSLNLVQAQALLGVLQKAIAHGTDLERRLAYMTENRQTIEE